MVDECEAEDLEDDLPLMPPPDRPKVSFGTSINATQKITIKPAAIPRLTIGCTISYAVRPDAKLA
jgi:hypothetical protein